MLLKSTLMCTPLSGMLPIDKRIILFAILSGVRKGNLYILIFKMMMGYRPVAVILSFNKSTSPLRDNIRCPL